MTSAATRQRTVVVEPERLEATALDVEAARRAVQSRRAGEKGPRHHLRAQRAARLAASIAGRYEEAV
jgi:hypothetical protein